MQMPAGWPAMRAHRNFFIFQLTGIRFNSEPRLVGISVGA